MKETVLKQARAWGFICQKDTQETWEILPKQPTERWKMKLLGDRWLLIVGNVPQLNFYPHEAIAFLERHHS
jgi:hypothetical protein